MKETAEAKSDGRRINETDFQLERKGAQSRADPVDDKPVSDAASRRKKVISIMYLSVITK